MGEIKLASLRETEPNTAVVLHPEWAAVEAERLDASWHRTTGGTQFVYLWGRHAVFTVPLRLVPGEERDVIHRWWAARERVLFTLDSSAHTGHVVCRITGSVAPLDHREAPHADRWGGLLRLEATDGRGRVGRPFILGHPTDGRLDQSDLSLI